MKPEILNLFSQIIISTIRENVRINSDRIFQIKSEAKPHINPKSELWTEYTSRKMEVTKLIVALHMCRGTLDKIKAHTTKRYTNIDQLAEEYLQKLVKKNQEVIS